MKQKFSPFFYNQPPGRSKTDPEAIQSCLGKSSRTPERKIMKARRQSKVEAKQQERKKTSLPSNKVRQGPQDRNRVELSGSGYSQGTKKKQSTLISWVGVFKS